MERRFHCTACGKCCYGKLPLSLNDAIANIELFPLAIQWTTVKRGAKAFDLTARLGTTVRLGKSKRIAVQIFPVSYMPPSFSCPALTPEGRCSIHENKPSRCRTMPFYPYREEGDQSDLLVPRNGWDCDISAAAPVVYRDKKIIHRKDFEYERQELVNQAATIRAYAGGLINNSPNVAAGIEKAVNKPRGGHMVLNFTAILPRLPRMDMTTFAQKQLPVLSEFADKTAGISEVAEFNRYYRDSAAGMKRFLDRI